MFANTTDADVLSIAHENVSQTEGALVPEGGDVNLLFWQFFFAENGMKMKEIGLWGRGSLTPPVADLHSKILKAYPSLLSVQFSLFSCSFQDILAK